MSDEVTVPRFLVWDEGCIECGEPSGAVGFCGTVDEAAEMVAAAEERQAAKWRGQHAFYVIDLTDPEMSEYAARVSS